MQLFFYNIVSNFSLKNVSLYKIEIDFKDKSIF